MKLLYDSLKKRKIVLASGSPRRRELLALLGLNFEVCPMNDVDESHHDIPCALDVAPQLARRKGAAFRSRGKMDADTVVISADTVVIVDDCVLGKPADADEARRMLHLLSDRTHLVVTGVDVEAQGYSQCRSQITEVTFAPLSDEEIDYYIQRYRPFDKAGAYGIQEWIGCIGVTGISGDYYNVMGLPLRLLYTMLREI